MAFWDTFGQAQILANPLTAGSPAVQTAAFAIKLKQLGVDPSQIGEDRLRNFATNAELRNQILANPMQFFPEQYESIQAKLPVNPQFVAGQEELDKVHVGIPGASAAGIAPNKSGNTSPSPLDVSSILGERSDATAGEKMPSLGSDLMSVQQILDLARAQKMDPESQAKFDELRSKAAGIEIQKPYVADKDMALAQAGFAMLGEGAGVSPLTAIGRGGAKGIAQLSEERKLALQSQQQYTTNLLSQTKMLADIDLASENANRAQQTLGLQAIDAAQRGKIAEMNNAISQMHYNVIASGQAPALFARADAMRADIDKLQQALKSEKDPANKEKLQTEINRRNSQLQMFTDFARPALYATGARSDQALRTFALNELKQNTAFMTMSPEQQQEAIDNRVAQLKASGVREPASLPAAP